MAWQRRARGDLFETRHPQPEGRPNSPPPSPTDPAVEPSPPNPTPFPLPPLSRMLSLAFILCSGGLRSPLGACSSVLPSLDVWTRRSCSGEQSSAGTLNSTTCLPRPSVPDPRFDVAASGLLRLFASERRLSSGASLVLTSNGSSSRIEGRIVEQTRSRTCTLSKPRRTSHSMTRLRCSASSSGCCSCARDTRHLATAGA